MAENLKTTKLNDGTAIPTVTVDNTWVSLWTPGICWYNNDITNKNTYGGLYNNGAVASGKLAPTGWHVPTDDEWNVLRTFVGGYLVAGGALKEAGTAHWVSPNTGSTNKYGFSAIPAGARNDEGPFFGMGTNAYWRSVGGTDWAINSGYTDLTPESKSLTDGYSVRCVRDNK
jgi:uncharacterized protein (TIGR02145 family)